MYDLIIIGSGEAGLSAASKARELGLETLVLSMEDSRKIQGVDFITDEVVGLGGFDEIKVTGIKGTYKARSLLLAIGSPKGIPPFDDVVKYTGNGVSYCAACDGFFYKDKKIAVVGYNEFMLHEVPLILGISANLSILTNGMPLELGKNDTGLPEGIPVDNEKIRGFYGDGFLQGVEFESGRREDYEGVFIAYGKASVTEFSMKTGLLTEEGRITADENGRTNLPHIFAAGDCTGNETDTAFEQGSSAAYAAFEYCRG